MFIMTTAIWLIEVSTGLREISKCSEKTATRALDLLKALTCTFTTKNLVGACKKEKANGRSLQRALLNFAKFRFDSSSAYLPPDTAAPDPGSAT